MKNLKKYKVRKGCELYAEINGERVKVFNKINGKTEYTDEFIHAYVNTLNLPLVERLAAINEIKSGKVQILIK